MWSYYTPIAHKTPKGVIYYILPPYHGGESFSQSTSRHQGEVHTAMLNAQNVYTVKGLKTLAELKKKARIP